MKLRAIPQIPNHLDPLLRAVLLAMKENIEALAGQRGPVVVPLQSDAPVTEVAAKVNELIARIS